MNCCPNTGEIAVTRNAIFNYDRDAVSLATGLVCTSTSRTQQSSIEEADINTIVRRFGVTGQLPQGLRMPSYGDFSGVWDYQTAQNALRSAQEAFNALPAEVRDLFSNDPGEFLEFASDPDNLPDLRDMGLAPPAPPAAPTTPGNPLPNAPSGA